MTRIATLWMVLCLTFNVLSGCGGKTENAGTDSNESWLSRCTNNADCSGGLQCLCNVCTRACESNGECSAAGEEATCLEPKQLECAAKAASICAIDEPVTPAPDASTPNPAGCRGLDQAACEAAEDCAPIHGSPIGAAAPLCLFPTQFAGCHGVDTVCNGAIGDALAPDGTCWRFSSCIPEEFTPTGNCSAADASEQPCADEDTLPLRAPSGECADNECAYCSELGEADCDRNPGCYTRRASRVNTEPYCAEPPEFFRCEPVNEAGCDDALAVLEVDGQCWSFNCIPSGIDDSADCRVNDEYPELCAP